MFDGLGSSIRAPEAIFRTGCEAVILKLLRYSLRLWTQSKTKAKICVPNQKLAIFCNN